MMRERGLESQSDLARAVQATPSQLGEILNFKVPPMTSDGEWKAVVLRLSDFFGCLPDEMFSPEQLTLRVKSNRRDYLLTHEQVMSLAQDREDETALLENSMDAEQFSQVIAQCLDTLTPREKRILEMRMGMGDRSPMTHEAIGLAFEISNERVRQIEAKALRKLRNPDTAGGHLLLATAKQRGEQL
jgi:RNA polymerase sigma factor (sigma-70 family)